MDLLGLDRCVQHPARIVILIELLERAGGWSFTGLRDHFGFSDGNLNRHLKVLVERGWVESQRRGKGRGSSTRLTLTVDGRAGLGAFQVWCAEVSGRLGHLGKGPGDSEDPVVQELVEDRSRDWLG